MRAGCQLELALLQACVLTAALAATSLPGRSAGGHRDTISRKKISPSQPQNAKGTAGDRVLIFWAAGSKKDTVELIKKNVQHARQQLPRVSVFLAHYDHQRGQWQDLAGQEWYKDNVDNSVEQDGYKFQLMKSLVSSGEIKIHDYDWVWVLDEDADFSGTPLPRMLQLATESGSLISTPAFSSTTGSKDMSYPFQQPRQDCRFRYAPVVEVTFPLFRAKALQSLMTECDHCMHEKSVWGFCRMWCSWSARRLGKKTDKACAILDGAPMVHRDFRTLNGKYVDATPYGLTGALNHFRTGFLEVQGGHPGSGEFFAMAMKDYGDVKAHHSEDFVNTKGAEMRELSCVK